MTIQNSLLAGGDSDGVQSGVGVNIIGNEFRDILDGRAEPHGPIQLLGARGSVIRGNWLHNTRRRHRRLRRRRRGADRGQRDRPARPALGHRALLRQRLDDPPQHAAYGSCVSAPAVRDHRPQPQDADDPAGAGTVVVDNIATEITLNNGSAVGERHHNWSAGAPPAGRLDRRAAVRGRREPERYAGLRARVGLAGQGRRRPTATTPGIAP